MANDIAKRLNPYLADMVVLYVKLHDLHWHVQGKMFVQVHLYTESRYDDLAEKFDAVAEKIIMLGEKPASSMKEFLGLASIKERSEKEYADIDVIKEVLADTEALRDEAKKLHDSFDEDGLFSVVMMLEEHIASYEKEIWFLKSMTK